MQAGDAGRRAGRWRACKARSRPAARRPDARAGGHRRSPPAAAGLHPGRARECPARRSHGRKAIRPRTRTVADPRAAAAHPSARPAGRRRQLGNSGGKRRRLPAARSARPPIRRRREIGERLRAVSLERPSGLPKPPAPRLSRDGAPSGAIASRRSRAISTNRPPSRSGHSMTRAPSVSQSSRPSSATSLCVIEPVEIDVTDRQGNLRRLIALQYRKGRTRRLARQAKAAQQAPRERRLAGAQIASEHDHIARPQHRCEARTEGFDITGRLEAHGLMRHAAG